MDAEKLVEAEGTKSLRIRNSTASLAWSLWPQFWSCPVLHRAGQGVRDFQEMTWYFISLGEVSDYIFPYWVFYFTKRLG